MSLASQKSANKLFAAIVAIFLATMTLIIFLFINILPYLRATISPLFTNQQVACDCAHHASLILSSPYHGGTMLFLGLALIVLMVYILFISLRKIFATRNFMTRAKRQVLPVSHSLSEAAASIGISSRVKEFDNDSHDVYCIGLFRPVIYVSSVLVRSVSIKQLRAILLHEKNHLRHRDPFRLLVVGIIRESLRFLPGVNQLVQQLIRIIELAADEHATNNFRNIKPLSLALIKILSLQSDVTEVHPRDVALSSLSVTEERIDRLLNTQTPLRFKWHLLRIGAGFIGLLFFGTVVLNSHMVFAQAEDVDLSMIDANTSECAMNNAWQDQMMSNSHQSCNVIQTVCQASGNDYNY